jgi:hypothetical protein
MKETQETKLNKKKAYIIATQIFNSEEYYSIEDYGELLTYQTCLKTTQGLDLLFNSKINLNKDGTITNSTVRANFLVDGNPKEVLIEKKKLDKIYAICKIYSEEDKFIKILINRTDKYDTDEILKKINEIRFFRGALNSINIKEFPLKNYYLEETKLNNIDNNTGDIQKEFILKKKNIDINNFSQNNNLIYKSMDKEKMSETWRNINKTNQNFSNNNNNQNIKILNSNTNSFINQNNNINNEEHINNPLFFKLFYEK